MFTTARLTAPAPRRRPRGRPPPPPLWGPPPAPPWTRPSGGWRPSARAGRAAASWSAPRLCCPVMTRMMTRVLTPASAGGWRSASSAGPPHSEQSSPVQSTYTSKHLIIVYRLESLMDCVCCRADMTLSCPMSGSRLLVMSSTVSRDLVSVSHYCGHHLTYDAAQDKCRGERAQSNLSGDQQISLSTSPHVRRR